MNNIIEERVMISGEINIGATISFLNKNTKNPLVLLIMGTGSLDRDGNYKRMKTNFYKNLSDFFVSQGFVCIRYDKRGTFESSGNFKTHSLTNLVDDANQVLNYGKGLKYVDENKVIVCGHSEGTMVGTLLSEKVDFEKLILLCGAGMSLKEAMIYQNYGVINEFANKKGLLAWLVRKTATKEKINKQLDDLFNKAKNAKKDKFFYKGVFMNANWLKEHDDLSGVELSQKVRKFAEKGGKVLAITGTADIQADSNCLNVFDNDKNITTFVAKDVNHMLRKIDDDNSYLNFKKQYLRLAKEPIEKSIQEQIIKFSKFELTDDAINSINNVNKTNIKNELFNKKNNKAKNKENNFEREM